MIETLLKETSEACTSQPVNKIVFEKLDSAVKNEFLFIIKPEIFARLSPEESKECLKLIFERFTKFSIRVNNMRVLNAAYLKKHQVIDQHYGVINAAAKDFNSQLSEEVRENFVKHYNKTIEESTVLGAMELESRYPELTDKKLQTLWSKVEIKRLAGGIYSGETVYKNETIYIVNGFHPPQLDHFIAENRVIVTMNLSSDLSWANARGKLIGGTYPEKAEKGTLRADLFNKFGKQGFDEAAYVINSVHLSAGPLEGLIELQRFNSDFQENNISSYNAFSFGKQLQAHFKVSTYQEILTNPMVQYNGKETSLFDLTEEKDADKALAILKEVYT